MTNVKKRDGRTEIFDRRKIESALRVMGLDETVARDVASKVPEREGITVDEIRTTVSAELRKRDAAMADQYDSTRTMPARSAVTAARGAVHLSEQHMKSLGLTPGMRVELRHATTSSSMRVEAPMQGAPGVHLNEADMKSLGVIEGTPVIVRKVA